MTFSKNWTSRKAVIAACHVPFLQELAEQTGIDSLSDAINFLIAEYRKQQSIATNSKTETALHLSLNQDEDFGLSDDLM